MAKNQTKNKAGYVDGFILTVPRKNFKAYKKMAEMGKKIWLKHGALDYKECIGDDLSPKPWGGPTPMTFLKLAKPKPGEVVWFSFITFKSKKHRDSVNAKVMKESSKDPSFTSLEMPFDVKRMTYGGFKVVVGS